MRELRKSKPITILLLILLMMLLIAPILPPFTPIPVRAQILLPHDPILITRDSDFTNPTNGVTKGSGKAENPYIIEGWEIKDTTGLDRGSIQIRGTQSYFIIRNVYIHPTSLLRESSGILFQNVMNAMIEDSRITNNTYGIQLAGSSRNVVKNNTVWSNTNGIYISSGSENVISKNQLSNNSQYGMWVTGTSSSKIIGNNASDTKNAGFIVTTSSKNLFEQNYASNNADGTRRGYGFRILSCTNSTFRNNTVYSNPFGMIFELSTGNLAIGNNATGNDYGMGLERQNHNNVFKSNIVTRNEYGIYIYNSSQNRVYDNYLRNIKNAYDDSTQNAWNINKTLGTNILGGPFLGGNFYSDYSGSDGDGDGLGDTPYSLDGRNLDRLPLVGTQPGSEKLQTPTVPDNSTLLTVITVIIIIIIAAWISLRRAKESSIT